MARILKFPFRKEDNARLTKIETDRAEAECAAFNAEMDAEIEEIHAKVDGEIKREYGSLQMYGLYTLQKYLSSTDWRKMIGSYDA